MILRRTVPLALEGLGTGGSQRPVSTRIPRVRGAKPIGVKGQPPKTPMGPEAPRVWGLRPQWRLGGYAPTA